MSELFPDPFSGLFPEQTSDDTDLGWGERPEQTSDEFYLENKPPHWG
ncbi:hypothetical protein HII36_33765 [Nonomuraea sp. NN258]|nr:hypothetical protein [Nonomuraea antri]NRQ36768.1 hypothetical protein [Nonomuraea antri]